MVSPAEFKRLLQIFGNPGGGPAPTPPTQLQVVNVSTAAAGGGDGTLDFPFQTRSQALAFIGSSATALAPYIIQYDPGTYTEVEFPLVPNVYDYAAIPGTVNFVLAGGSNVVSLDSSWSGATANYFMDGLLFDPDTTLGLDFSAAVLPITANLYFCRTSFPDTAGSSIDASGSNVNAVFKSNFFAGNLTLTSFRGVTAEENNEFSGMDIETGVMSGEIKATFNNNKSLGDVIVHSQGSASVSATFRSSPASSYTLQAESKSSIVASIDSPSWQMPNVVGGDVTVTQLTHAESIEVQYNALNYTAASKRLEDQFPGIDAALGTLGNNTVGFNAGQSQAVAPFTAQSIPNAVTTLVEFNAPQVNVGSYYDPTPGISAFKPLIAGLFPIFAKVTFDIPTGTDGIVLLTLIKNGDFGTPVAATDAIRLPKTDSQSTATVPLITNVALVPGDSLQIYAHVTGNGGAALNVIAYPFYTYFGGSLANQSASPVTPSTVLQRIHVSKKGSDPDGHGTIDFPFETPDAAQNFILGLGEATFGNPYQIVIDTGSFVAPTKIYPNILWEGAGAGLTTLSDNGSNITFDSSWEGTSSTTAQWGFSDLTLGAAVVLNLNTTGFTTLGGELSFNNCSTEEYYNLVAADNAHDLKVTLNNANMAVNPSTNATIDSIINLFAYNSRFITDSNVQFLSNVGDMQFNVQGDKGTSEWLFTSGPVHAVGGVFTAGSPMSYSWDSTDGGPVVLEFDGTTYNKPQSASGTATVTHNLLTDTYATQILTDAATVTWDFNKGWSAQLTMTANRTIANPTGNNQIQGPLAVLELIQDATGGWTPAWGGNFYFPNGAPVPNLAPNAVTYLIFAYNTNGQMQLVGGSGYTGAPDIEKFGGGTDGDVTITSPTTLTSDKYYRNLTISGSGQLITSGWKVFVSGITDVRNATIADFITASGAAGSAGSGATGGAAPAVPTIGSVGISFGTIASVSGGNGGSGGGGSGGGKSQSGAQALANGFIGSVGGTGGAPGTSGGAGVGGASTTTATVTAALSVNRFAAELIRQNAIATVQWIQGAGHGVGGGGGSGASDGAQPSQSGGGAGAGGGGGNILYFMTNILLTGPSTHANGISCKGGGGGNGASVNTGSGFFGGGGGGGGGGASGGWAYFGYNFKYGASVSNLIDASGGNGGNGGLGGLADGVGGVGAGNPGAGGVGGHGGRITLLNFGGGVVTETIGSAGGAASGATGGTGNAVTVSL